VPDIAASVIGILVLATATYLTRLAGYFLGGHIRPDSVASRVLDTLPGAALAGVLALSLSGVAMIDMLAVAAGVTAFLLTGRTLVGILGGLALAVANAHWLA
jgi:uncharacterized membrane protein